VSGETLGDVRDALVSVFEGRVALFIKTWEVPSSGVETRVFVWTEKRQRVESMWLDGREKRGWIQGFVTGILYPEGRQPVVDFWKAVLAEIGGSAPSGATLGSFASLVESYTQSRARTSTMQNETRRKMKMNTMRRHTGCSAPGTV
jgi:hypothetical protein